MVIWSIDGPVCIFQISSISWPLSIQLNRLVRAQKCQAYRCVWKMQVTRCMGNSVSCTLRERQWRNGKLNIIRLLSSTQALGGCASHNYFLVILLKKDQNFKYHSKIEWWPYIACIQTSGKSCSFSFFPYHSKVVISYNSHGIPLILSLRSSISPKTQ